MARRREENEPFRLSRTADDERYARLRSDGADEMRRRWREAERAGVLKRDPDLIFFLVEVEKYASAAKPEEIRRIRENLGDREAEFRQGVADEASSLLRRIFGQGYRLGELAKGEWFELQRKR